MYACGSVFRPYRLTVGMIFISAKVEAEFDRLAAAFDRPAEEIPEIALALLTWYVEQRSEGFELLLGRRDNPDDRDEMQLYRVPEFRLLTMNEQGVEDLGSLACTPAAAMTALAAPLPSAVEPVATTIEAEPVLDEWDELVFLEASRQYCRGEQALYCGAIVYELCSQRYGSGRYGEEIWDEALRVELERLAEQTLTRLAAAGWFSVSRFSEGGGSFWFTPQGLAASDRLYGN
jgi:hypothetical protein